MITFATSNTECYANYYKSPDSIPFGYGAAEQNEKKSKSDWAKP